MKRYTKFLITWYIIENLRRIAKNPPGFQALLMHDFTGMDITVNQGWDERMKDNNDKNMAVMKRFDDLPPTYA
jgi:hypothetical protein